MYIDFMDWAELVKKGRFSEYNLEVRIERALREAFKLGVQQHALTKTNLDSKKLPENVIDALNDMHKEYRKELSPYKGTE